MKTLTSIRVTLMRACPIVLLSICFLLSECNEHKANQPKELKAFSSKKSDTLTDNGVTNVYDNGDLDVVGINTPLHTDYFDVTLKRYKVVNRINVGNVYLNKSGDEDSKYILLDLKFKNTDSESRMITHGQVVISYKGKNLNFDAPENIYVGKWITGLEQINPLTSLEGYVAYKLPKELSGTAYFHPGRANGSQLIRIGIL